MFNSYTRPTKIRFLEGLQKSLTFDLSEKYSRLELESKSPNLFIISINTLTVRVNTEINHRKHYALSIFTSLRRVWVRFADLLVLDVDLRVVDWKG